MTLSIDLSAEQLEKILLDDRGTDLLMEKVFNEILQAEMTEHLRADRFLPLLVVWFDVFWPS